MGKTCQPYHGKIADPGCVSLLLHNNVFTTVTFPVRYLDMKVRMNHNLRCIIIALFRKTLTPAPVAHENRYVMAPLEEGVYARARIREIHQIDGRLF